LFDSKYVLPIVLNARRGNGGEMEMLRYSELLDNCLLFANNGSLHTLITLNNIIVNNDKINVEPSMLQARTLGEWFDLDTDEERRNRNIEYCVKTLRGYFYKKVGLSEGGDNILFGSAVANLSSELQNARNLHVANITKFKTLVGYNAFPVGNTNVYTVEDLSIAYTNMYLSIAVTRKNIDLLIKGNIEIPIKFIILRQADLVTTSTYKILESGQTLSLEYSSDHTIIRNTANYHGVQYNFSAGFVYEDPDAIQKFYNISVISVSRCDTNFFSAAKKATDRTAYVDMGAGYLTGTSEGSCFVIPVPFHYDFSSMDIFDIFGSTLRKKNRQEK